MALLCTGSLSAQKKKNKKKKTPPPLVRFTQTVRGTVIDKDTKQPLIGATVQLLDVDTIAGVATDIDGKFKLEKVPVGRRTLAIDYLGYQQQILSNLEVITGHETVLNIALEEAAFEQKEITIVASKQNKDKAINDMALGSVRQFRTEESERYAGSRADISRMAANYAGVAGA